MDTLRATLIAAFAAFAAFAAPAAAQSAGDLLVANPELTDSMFAESVVLLIHHDTDGSIGLLLNRPTWVEPVEIFEDLAAFEVRPERLFFGGPVQPTRLLLLIREPPPALIDDAPVFAGVHITGNPAILGSAEIDPTDERRLRLYAGHAQWAPGQLDAEIADGAWRTRPANAELVFDTPVAELWRHARESAAERIVGIGPGSAGRPSGH